LTVTRFPGVPLQPLEHHSLMGLRGKGSKFFRDLLSLRTNFFLSGILWLTLQAQNVVTDE
ncbi:MAG: hypothetical protein ACI4UN_08175, partial [Muribaculaceae bacterium]